MNAKESLEQRFGDGRVLTIGTDDYNQAYYQLGEWAAITDLNSVGAPFFGLKMKLKPEVDSEVTAAHVCSYLTVLKMIATNSDSLYTKETRQQARTILSPHQKLIKQVLSTHTINQEQLQILLDVYLKWGEYCTMVQEK